MAATFELDIPSTEKLVLLAMADHARDDGTGCYPSIDRLAKKSSLSRRGVQKIMRRLEQEGWIVPSKVSKGRLTTEYRITLANREPRSLFPAGQPRTPGHSTANLSASNREPGSPEPSRTIIKPKTKTPRSRADLPLFEDMQKELKDRRKIEARDRREAFEAQGVGRNRGTQVARQLESELNVGRGLRPADCGVHVNPTVLERIRARQKAAE
jgi:biotin operon repressor